MKNLTPPKWAPNAVATEQGWTDPKTGEILVSLKGLKSKIEAAQPPAVVLDIETPVECPVENTFVEITTEPVLEKPKVVEEVSEKRGRGRPKKNQTGK